MIAAAISGESLLVVEYLVERGANIAATDKVQCHLYICPRSHIYLSVDILARKHCIDKGCNEWSFTSGGISVGERS